MVGRGGAPDYADRAEEMEADEHAVDADEDLASNELHAEAGSTCPRCGRPIEPGQAVRRMVSGEYQHDSC